MKIKQKMISRNEIKAKEQQALVAVEKLIRTSKENKHSSPAQEFLRNIHNLLIKLHKNNVSYAKISRWIYNVYAYKVSAQSVRKYIQKSVGTDKSYTRLRSDIDYAVRQKGLNND